MQFSAHVKCVPQSKRTPGGSVASLPNASRRVGCKNAVTADIRSCFFFFFLQLMVVMELFFMTTADFGVCGSPVCSPEAVVWLLGLGSNGFCDTVPVVVV